MFLAWTAQAHEAVKQAEPDLTPEDAKSEALVR